MTDMHSVSAQANNCPQGLLGRSQNHDVQKALMEYLLLGRLV